MESVTQATTKKQLGLLLACFDGHKTAGKARRSLDEQLRAQGNDLLDTVVLEVDAKHRASTHDPHRVLYGTLTPALMWGLFGLLLGSYGVASALIWAVLGAICGSLFNYFVIHHATKSDLVRIGSRLPAQSSALAMGVETPDPRRLLEAITSHQPSVASVVAIDDDLTASVFAGPTNLVEAPPSAADGPQGDDAALLSMILLRYPSPETANQMATQMVGGKGAPSPFEVELVIRSDPDGHRHVTDPEFGVAAAAKSDIVSWGGLGLVLGAIGGAISGGGVLGLLQGGLSTGIIWGLGGLAAGAVYGFAAGRVVSARSLKSVGPLLAPGTSMVVAWTGEPIAEDALRPFITPESRQLVLRFNAVGSGAVLAIV
jgi:uncharacterized membrane protein